MRDRQYHQRKRNEKQGEAQRRKRADTSRFLSPPRRQNKRSHASNYDSEDDEENRSRKQKRRRFQKAVLRPGEPISLRLLDWQRRQTLEESTKNGTRESERDVRNRLQVPHALSKLDIGFRLPTWESVKPTKVHHPNQELDPLRGRHSDDVYASWCHKLINCLSGSARSWATHEFFYSDIDRAW